MSEPIEVLEIGSAVTIDKEIPAVVRAVRIFSPTFVEYLCVWWDERARKEEWLMSGEIKPFDGHRTMRISMRK